ncbi:class I SAM-dependent methyltransferase [bacterium]|nr:class I SAM-dependent methyltransferase [bacterium]
MKARFALCVLSLFSHGIFAHDPVREPVERVDCGSDVFPSMQFRRATDRIASSATRAKLGLGAGVDLEAAAPYLRHTLSMSGSKVAVVGDNVGYPMQKVQTIFGKSSMDVKPIASNLSDLPKGPAQYDVILWMENGIANVSEEQREETFLRLRSQLKPGGRLVIGVESKPANENHPLDANHINGIADEAGLRLKAQLPLTLAEGKPLHQVFVYGRDWEPTPGAGTRGSGDAPQQNSQ